MHCKVTHWDFRNRKGVIRDRAARLLTFGLLVLALLGSRHKKKGLSSKESSDKES